MHRIPPLIRLFCLLNCLAFPLTALAVPFNRGVAEPEKSSITSTWSSSQVQLMDGLPGLKPKQKGSLKIGADAITFSGKTDSVTIQMSAVIAANAGNERVELGGTPGRLLRMTLPDGGGQLVATVMHHRVDMLSVEFLDAAGAYHAALFLLPSKEAERALATMKLKAGEPPQATSPTCQSGRFKFRTVSLPLPDWQGSGAPAAYRALLYERLMDKLAAVQGVDHVSRQGEASDRQDCAEFTVKLSVSDFHQGNQVARAALGPAGMFVGATRVKFDLVITDVNGKELARQQMSASIRGDSESIKVTDSVAKKVAKQLAKLLRQRKTASSGPNLSRVSDRM